MKKFIIMLMLMVSTLTFSAANTEIDEQAMISFKNIDHKTVSIKVFESNSWSELLPDKLVRLEEWMRTNGSIETVYQVIIYDEDVVVFYKKKY